MDKHNQEHDGEEKSVGDYTENPLAFTGIETRHRTYSSATSVGNFSFNAYADYTMMKGDWADTSAR